MNRLLNIATDCACLAVFDPAVTTAYDADDLDEFHFEQIRGVQDGQFFGFSIGGDGVYRVRVTDERLTEDERDYAAGHLSGLGLEVRSGRICIGGYGFQRGESAYDCVEADSGRFMVDVYEILWDVSPNRYRDEFDVPSDAPADFVFILTRVVDGMETARSPLSKLRMDALYLPPSGGNSFIFSSETRRVGTEIGAILTSTVIKSAASLSGLRLKSCGIEGYKVDLDRYDGLNWKDRVKFRVRGINHNDGLFSGEFIERLPTEI